MKMLGLPFVSIQDYLHLAYREEEREMLPLCRAEGIAVIPWSPMARGYLAGTKPPESAAAVRARTDSSQDDLGIGTGQDHAIRERVVAVADRLGTRPPTVALAWVLGTPGVTAPIIGTSKPHHLPDALAALELTLDAETRAYLEQPYQPRKVAGHA
jgi:1-deoxyxylulose-5-phosphate synthase